MLRLSRVPVLCLLLLAACGTSALADEWPLPFHDSANTSISSERVTLPLRPAWRVKAGPVLQMVAGKGRVYTAELNQVVARDLRTGRQVWRAEGKWTSLCLFRDLVIVTGSEYGKGRPPAAAAYLARTGRLVWQTPGGTGMVGSGGVTVHAGRLYTTGGLLREVDPRDGRAQHRAEVGMGYGLPAFFDSQVYLGGGHEGYVLALPDLRGRRLGLWDAGAAYPIYWKGYLITQGPVLYGQAFPARNPKAARGWYTDKGSGHGVAPVGTGIVLERDGRTGVNLVAWDLLTGRRRWTAPMIPTSLTSFADGLIFVVGTRGKQSFLHALDPHTGRVRARYRLGKAGAIDAMHARVPVIAEGYVLVATEDGVACFRG